MAQAYNSIKAAIQNAADLLGGLVQIALGTPDDFVLYPTETGVSGQMARATGQVWDSTTGVVWRPLEKIGDYLDAMMTLANKNQPARAIITTNATLVAPTIVKASGITAVSKNEAFDTLSITINPAFVGDDDYVLFCTLYPTPAVQVVTTKLAGSFILYWIDPTTGVKVPINGRTVGVLAVGQL